MDMNLYEAIKDRKKYLSEKKAKSWIYQTLKALDFMHRNGIFHRDIKPENILIRNNQIKLADLGSCKCIFSKPPFTEYISTRWYRSPECLLTDGYYNYKMDIWGLGCVFFEILTLVPLFPGDDEIDQVNKINYILGSPPDDLYQKFVKNSAHREKFFFEYQKGVGINKFLSHIDPKIVDLINKMLEYDPDKRFTAKQCLNHECFKELIELEIKMNNNMNNNNKVSQVNLYQNSLLMKSFNDSNSYLKVDDVLLQNQNNKNNQRNNNNSHSKTVKQKKEGNVSNLSLIGNNITKNQNANNKYNYNKLLPSILLNHINEDSKGEDSFNNSSISKNHQDSYLRLPKISENKIILRNIANLNLMNSNEFKKLKHNISNHSIENGITSLFTQYEKKQVLNIRKKINEVKKKYVSPYSKKTIENNLLI